MKIGYARTSTVEQCAGLAAQLRRLLEEQGCEEIFQEQVSSVAGRAQLDMAIRMLRPGDVLVVTKLDRFARNLEHALQLGRAIEQRGASLKVLDPDIDTGSPMGRLMFGLLGSIAQWEREIMLERQAAGIAKAKGEGKYVGRQPTARRQSEAVLALKAEGVGASEIARRLKIGRASVYRILATPSGASADGGGSAGSEPG